MINLFKPGDRIVAPSGRRGVVLRVLKAHGDVEFQYEDDASVNGLATLRPHLLVYWREPQQIAKSLDREDPRRPEPGGGVFGKNPIGVMFGRLGSSKGGKARALKLSPERRHEIAQLAAIARFHGVKSDKI